MLSLYPHTSTITIKKLEKDDYIVFKVYRLIVLLNTLSKTLKLIMSRKIFYLTKTHRLLLDTQMRIRRDRFIKSALELCTKQVHIVWNQSNNKIITLLSINVTRVVVGLDKTRRGCPNLTHWWGWTPYFVQWVGLSWWVCPTPKPNPQPRRPPPIWKKRESEIIF
jgi:hypothetical protein